MKIRELLKKIRAALKELFKYSVYDAAKFNGLAIEYPQGIPAKFDGHLDTDDPPRFIAVNPQLPKHEQVYVIARELARFAQQRQVDSLFVNRPWKRRLLATAPVATRGLIYRLDLEVRADWVMYWHAAKADYFSYIKHHRRKQLAIMFATNIADFLFLKLRIRSFLYGILSALRLVQTKPIVPVF
jgi:hypothetical protein